MVAVFLGAGAGGSFRKTVARILREQAEVIEVSRNRIVGRARSGQVTAIFQRELSLLHLLGSAVFLNRCSSGTKISAERYLICNSANHTDLELAKKSGGEVITCGMSLRDSVTFSSFTDERCVISVQRTLKRFDGRRVEPFEFPCRCLPDDDRYGILCANLLLILLGKI